jgi:hypothetical protein
MIEPESPDAFPGPLAEDDLHDADRSLVDELFLDAGKDAAGNSGLAETAPLIPGLATASARERIKYSSAVKRVLNFLTEGDAADETDAEKSFAEARQICADDPRLPLAYGLYLQRIGQTATARTILEECAEHEGKSYLLISQAAAVNRLLINDLRRAWPHLMHLADLTGQPARDTYPTDGQRRRAAEWLGAAAAFLESLPEDIDGRQFVNGAELRSHLPESLQAVFDTGQTETGRHLAEFTQWIGLPAGEAAGQLAQAIAKLEAQRQSAVKEIATFQESVHEATTGLRAANDLEKKSRGEWTLAARQKRQAQEAIANLSQPRTYSYTQTTYTTTTDAQGRRQRVPQTVVRQRAENSSERSARLAQLQEASAALSKVDAVLPGLKNKFDQARLAREELVGQVRGQTAESRSQLAVAQRRLHQTERLLSRLQELTADPEKLSDRIHSPTLLLDWNVEEIADRLRATFDSPGKDRGP